MIDAENILKTPLNDITSAVKTEESEGVAAHMDVMKILLETGHDKDDLKLTIAGEQG